MSRKNRARRFDSEFGLGAELLEEEARWLKLEVDGYSIFTPEAVEAKGRERYAAFRKTWDHLHLLVSHVPERNRRIIESLLFRDLLHIMQIYGVYVCLAYPEAVKSSLSAKSPSKASGKSSESLFNP
jgi:hypothetical protein